MTLVLDASLTMAWCFEDEAAPIADRVLERLQDETAVVPDLWHLEVANVLLVAGRKSRITEVQADRFLSLLGQLPIHTSETGTDIPAVLTLGRRHGISSYDAEYLLLARTIGAELATLDEALAAAARADGVNTVG